MIIAATGHRPDKLGGYSDYARTALEAFAMGVLGDIGPDKVISGMAQGWDQAVAEACICLGIPFIAAVPFPSQPNLWPEPAQRRWQRLIAACERIDLGSSENPKHKFEAVKLLGDRNHWMVDNADQVLALWNGDLTGGTANCVRYAERRKKPPINVWSQWELRGVLLG
jgi:uncharacterized phage-like protein YoqJ